MSSKSHNGPTYLHESSSYSILKIFQTFLEFPRVSTPTIFQPPSRLWKFYQNLSRVKNSLRQRAGSHRALPVNQNAILHALQRTTLVSNLRWKKSSEARMLYRSVIRSTAPLLSDHRWRRFFIAVNYWLEYYVWGDIVEWLSYLWAGESKNYWLYDKLSKAMTIY